MACERRFDALQPGATHGLRWFGWSMVRRCASSSGASSTDCRGPTTGFERRTCGRVAPSSNSSSGSSRSSCPSTSGSQPRSCNRSSGFASELSWRKRVSSDSPHRRPLRIEAIRRGLRLHLSPSGEAEIVAPWRVPALYAEHLGLVRSGVMMPAGQLLLSLADQGARRWLLTLEVHQSLGTDDPWRLPRSHLELLLQYPTDEREQRDTYPDAFWPHERLGALGLVEFGDDGMGNREWYSLSEPNAADLRAAMAEQSPMWALAKAITPDPGAALPGLGTDAAQRIGARQAGRAAAELGRTAAHELMNVLPLMESSLQQLGQLLKGTTQELGAASQMKQLGGNLDRLFRYADWFKQLGEGLDRPPERFGARAMLEDAILLANGGTIERELTILPELSLYGLRDRLVIALVNLLRNARQHGASRVRVSARTDQQQLFIEVEDDGPGVPSEKVPMVFVSSFSTRADGTGQGLPLVKHVIEDEHQGSIGYSRSSLGGARFMIRLPV